MLKTERMTRALLVGTMDALEETVDFLYRSRSCHIINFKKDDVYDIGMPLPHADETSSKLLKMMGISKNLELEEEQISADETFSTAKIHSEVDAALTHFDLEISAEVHGRIEVESLLNEKREEQSFLKQFSHIDFSLSLLSGYNSMSVFCGRVRGDPSKEIEKLTAAHDIISDNGLFLLFIDNSFEDAASKILSSHGFEAVPAPIIHERPKVSIQRLGRDIADLKKRLERIQGRLEKLKKKHSLFITASVEELTIEANKAETPLRFGTATHSFVIDLWAPTDSFGDLNKGLAKIKLGAVELVEVAHPEESSPPIRLKNSKAARPFEMLLEMFSMPSYDETDPSALMLFTFPLFYGLMLGDIGYGLLILILVLSGGLTKLMTKLGMAGGAPGLTKILLYCGITSVIFGVLYNEIFGFELFALQHGHGDITILFPQIFYPEFLIPKFLVFGPIHFPVIRGDAAMVAPMLIFCVWVGVAHIMLGYIVGFRNVWMQHGIKTAILEKGGWILILTGLTLFAFSAMPDLIAGNGIQFTNPQVIVGIALLLTGTIMAFMVEGINTLLELPGLSGNLLSYTRIYAIGLSSIGIAMAFNEEMALPAIEGGGFGIVIGIAVLIAGHGLNLGLGIIGPLIQTLRLHYVEFFTKFYKGGGTKFNPLRYNRKYTKEV